MTTPNLARDPNTVGWEQTIYAFLAEKERRSGSMRTAQAYSRMLFHFFGSLGKTPDLVAATEVFSCAQATGLSGKKPSSVTIGARIACLSSFYRFLIRMGLVSGNLGHGLLQTGYCLGQFRGGGSTSGYPGPRPT